MTTGGFHLPGLATGFWFLIFTTFNGLSEHRSAWVEVDILNISLLGSLEKQEATDTILEGGREGP